MIENKLNGTHQKIEDAFQLICDELNHSEVAKIVLYDAWGSAAIRIYFNTRNYTSEEYDDIREHLSDITSSESFPQYTVSELDKFTTPDMVPDGIDSCIEYYIRYPDTNLRMS